MKTALPVAAACILVVVSAASASAQKYVSTEVTAGVALFNAVSAQPGWFVDAMKLVLPKVGIVGEVMDDFRGDLPIISGGIRGRFGREGPNGYVQVLIGRYLTYNGGDTAASTLGFGVTFPINPKWAMRARADLHIEGEGAAGVFGVGATRQWGAR